MITALRLFVLNFIRFISIKEAFQFLIMLLLSTFYLAKATDLVSLITVTLICPG